METPQNVGEAAARLFEKFEKVVVKLLSKTITHKSDVGGVVLAPILATKSMPA
ncbi:MAG: hypothetical protein ACPG2A_05710 [Parvibaculales bacterium]